MTIPYAEVIGDPIAHSKSPLIHNFWLKKLGIAGDYRKAHVTAEGLADYFATRRTDPDWRGCNVTIPHKESVLNLVDVLDPSGTEIGAINCIVPINEGLKGLNTDSDGIIAALGNEVIDTAKPICLIGAGGAARAALSALDMMAVYQINLVVRDVAKGRALLDSFDVSGQVFQFAEAEQALRDVVGILNASPLGMTGYPAMPATILNSLENMFFGSMVQRSFVFDMVYSPLCTPLLEMAKSQGLTTIDGLAMLIGQADWAFKAFFGQPAPREHDVELRALLTA